jgi:hypothetical protein
MRAHPIALGCYGQPASVLDETAVGVARITHAHKHGITGGFLQTLAVHQVRYICQLYRKINLNDSGKQMQSCFFTIL